VAVSSIQLQQLSEKLEQLARGSKPSAGASGPQPGGSRADFVSTRWPEVDGTLQGLRLGVVHEWFGLIEPRAAKNQRDASAPPLQIFSHLAACAAATFPRGVVVWIGRACWPHPQILAMRDRLLARSIFVADTDAASRLWATDLTLRSRAVAAVIADGRGLNMRATRRLQLAASAAAALALVARPYHEIDEISAAATRWLVQPVPTPTKNPRWSVELLRCKGVQPNSRAPRQWVLEGDHVSGVVCLPADVVDRSGAQTRAQHEAERASGRGSFARKLGRRTA